MRGGGRRRSCRGTPSRGLVLQALLWVCLAVVLPGRSAHAFKIGPPKSVRPRSRKGGNAADTAPSTSTPQDKPPPQGEASCEDEEPSVAVLGVTEVTEGVTNRRQVRRRTGNLLPAPQGARSGVGSMGESQEAPSLSRYLPALKTEERLVTEEGAGELTYVRRTVDLYVPAKELEMLMTWAERLEELTPGYEPNLARVDVREQRLLALAQAYLWLEKTRMELAEGRPPGTVTVREVALSLNLRVEEVQAFYKMGLRARSYILMSMHKLINGMAIKYSSAFNIEKEELIQEGYKGAMAAVERYDHAKATATGSTFRNFAQFYVMTSMIQAAKREARGGAPFERREGKSKQQGALQRLLPRPVAGQLPSQATTEGDAGGALVLVDDDAQPTAEQVSSTRRRRKTLRIPKKVYGYLPSDETMLDDKGSVLFGVDPELSKPAYDILDERKRAKDMAAFLDEAAKEIPKKDMEVLAMVYGLNGEMPLKRAQVAKKLGVQPAAVHRSEKRVLKKLRELLQLQDST